MEEYIIKEGKKLRLGYTTGSCAAAAAKAAAYMLLTGKEREFIDIQTPKGISLHLPVHHIERTFSEVTCSVEKDSGDDPDVTKGIHIYASVSFAEPCEETLSEEKEKVLIFGGEGIGRVTKRGLDQPVGEAAINSVPRKMIRKELEEVMELTDCKKPLKVLIFAPDGEEIARKTFNPRLGITGGISILGTTGIVEPMSEQALLDTIRIELKQRRENGSEYILLTPGNYGSEFIEKGMGIDPKTAVTVSNFIGESLKMCSTLGFRGALLVGHIGKLVKVAGGITNTHSRYGDCRMEIMAAYAAAEGLSGEKTAELLTCATCDDVLRILKEEDERKEGSLYEKTLLRLSKRIAFMTDQMVKGEMETGAVLFSREYGFLCETENSKELLKKILEE